MPKGPDFTRVGGNMFENAANVKVEEVDVETLRQLFPGTPKVNLGAEANPTEENIEREAITGGVLEKFKEHSTRAFQLAWKGGRVPRGAIVAGQEIGWTQHGMVTSKDGRQIGTYERVIDSTGGTGEENLMLVFLFPENKIHK